ncbi:hypothetical protein Ndes2526B_g05045 [Nannochloris sp. 'desiccata']|nr:hypothetical protein KSW81_006205 [Chlorella desiccata (nom. nud.)]KAH7619787.1 hypothetical protein NADE_008073 [Chlorella desiccata (nom. nud.)]
MANFRDALQDIGNDLGALAGTLPQGSFQQVAASLAPGQQMQNQLQVLINGQQQIHQQLQQQHQQLQQQHQQLQQMQPQLQRVEEGLAVVTWTFRNDRIRAANRRDPDNLQPLHVEQTGGNTPAGNLPPATVHFPNNVADALQLTASQLNQLQVFYHAQFAGPHIGARRAAFQKYIMGPQ